MRTTLFFIFLCLTSVAVFAQNTRLTPQQMKADLDHLNKYLRKWHPAYYAYTPKERMDAYYNTLKINAKSDTSLSHFRPMIWKAVNQVGCGHMGVFNPKVSKTSKADIPILPFKVWVLSNRLFVKSLFKPDSILSVGDEILSIDGVSAANLIQQTAEFAFTDGRNQTYKMYGLEVNFNAFHFFIYGQKGQYTLNIKNKAGETATVIVKAQTAGSTLKKPVEPKDSAACVIKGGGIALYKTAYDSSTRVLDIDHFNGKKQGKTYKEVFKYLKKHKIQNLVIDLRYNGGGNVFQGNKLLSYLLDQSVIPINISRKPNLTFINPRFKAGFWERITPILFTLNPLQYPNKNGWNHFFFSLKHRRNHFNGKIYVLTNGGTFSMGSYVASFLKNKKQALIIGEETGGSEYGSRAMASGNIVLPNSKFRVHLNVYQMTHALNIEDKAHGVIPDYPIFYTIEDKLNQKDLEMAKIQSLIEKK